MITFFGQHDQLRTCNPDKLNRKSDRQSRLGSPLASREFRVPSTDPHVLTQRARADLLFAEQAAAQNARTSPSPAGDAAVSCPDPLVREHPPAERATFALRGCRPGLSRALQRLSHQARRKQYRNKPIPKMKKSRNRAKKRGPIIAEIRKNNLIDLPSGNLKSITNLRFVVHHAFTATRHGIPNRRAHDLVAAR